MSCRNYTITAGTRKLSLQRCTFDKVPFKEMLQEMDQLNKSVGAVEILNLENNVPQINEIIQKSIQRTNLNYLEVRYTNCSTMDNETFKNGDSLYMLGIYTARIVHLRNGIFHHLINLEVLSLSSCSLESLESDAFKNLTKLYTLRFDTNYIKILPKNIFKDLVSLTSLSIYSNLFEDFDVNLFSTLTELKSLNLKRNSITSIKPKQFQHNKKLRTLLLNENKIKTIGRDNILIFKNLLQLDLDKNVCVMQTFKFTENEISLDTSSLISAILFPLCDEDSQLEDSNKDNKSFSIIVFAKISILMILLVILIVVPAYFRKQINKNNIQKFQNPTEEFNFNILVTEYVNETTVHGIRYIGENKNHWMERIFWGIVFIVSCILSFILIFKTYTKWQESPVIIGFEKTTTKIYEIPFPTITICAEKKFPYQKAWKYEDFQARNEEFGWSNLEAFSQICPEVHNNNIDLFKNLTYKDADNNTQLFNNFVFRQHWIYKYFQYQILWMNQKNNIDIDVLTDVGFCKSFNLIWPQNIIVNATYWHFIYDAVANRGKMYWDPEHEYSKDARFQTFPLRLLKASANTAYQLTIDMEVNSDDIMCEENVEGFKVQVHYPGEWPFISEKSFNVPYDVIATMKIKPKITKTDEDLRPYKPNIRKCYFQDENPLIFFLIYSKSNCELECWSNFTLKACQCVPFYLPKTPETRICNYFDISCIRMVKKNIFIPKQSATISSKEEDKLCECLPACNSVEYEVTMSQSSMGIVQNETVKRQTTTIFNAIIDEDEFVALERSELFGMTDFIGNCGGLLGLFMGVSVLSIIELIYYFTIRVLFRIFKKKVFT